MRDLKLKKYAAAQININQSIRGPITDLVATLLSGWASYGAGDAKTAVATIDKLTGPEWYPIFKDLHAGHDPRTLGQGKGRRRALRARLQARRFHAARVRRLCALAVAQQGCGGGHRASTRPSTRSCRAIRWCRKRLRETKAGKKLPPLVDSAQAGAAEALYGIGATLTRRGGEDLALVYLQLALYLQPNHPLALLSLADLYESVKKPAMAIKVYERVPASSPLKRNAQIQLATDLDAADRSDEAIKILKDVTAEDSKDLEAIMALGNIERGRKKFADCAATYSQGIDVLPASNDKNTWVDLLLPRHLRGALQAVDQGRSRHAQGARAAARAAACAELSRLFLDRSGHQSRRRHEDDQARRRSASRRRLHRRTRSAGPITASAITMTR